MNLKIRPSFKMSKDKSPLGNIEDRLIRIPMALRTKFDLDTGLFLRLKSTNGELLPLQVSPAYADDVIIDSRCAYVSDTTYSEIGFDVIKRLNPADDILLGCDPEFFIVDTMSGHNISASHFFPFYGAVGSDAGLAELRPRPSTDVENLTKNMENLMFQAYKHLSNRMIYKKRPIRMLAASMHDNATAGFHIHFGLPNFLLNSGTPEIYNLLLKIVYILDYYIGITSIMPEGNEDYCRRSQRFSQYGKAGDFRTDNKVTMEYRVPGGHLLRHPILTLGLLALSRTVMKDILSRLKKLTNDFSNLKVLNKYNDIRDLYPNIPDRSHVYTAISSETIGKAVSYIDKIYDDFTKMISYSANETYITDYFNYVAKYLSRGKKFTDSIEYNWRLMSHEG